MTRKIRKILEKRTKKWFEKLGINCYLVTFHKGSYIWKFCFSNNTAPVSGITLNYVTGKIDKPYDDPDINFIYDRIVGFCNHRKVVLS